MRYLPRFRYVSQLEVFRNDTEVLNYLSRLSAGEMVDTAVSSSEALASVSHVPEGLTIGEVKKVFYSPDEILLKVKSSGNSLLIIGNTWNPNWEATVDGKVRPLFRVNHTQLGLFLSPEDRRVQLRYRPIYSWWVPFFRSNIDNA